MKKKKTSRKHVRKGRLMQVVAVCGAIFGMLNGAATFVENIPKVANEVSTAIYGPPVTYGEIESLRVLKPQW